MYGAGSGNFLTGMDALGMTLFLSSCALGMAVNVSSCFVNGKASALAYAMLGLAKTITVILVGIAFFDGAHHSPPRGRHGDLRHPHVHQVDPRRQGKAAALKNSGLDVRRDTGGDEGAVDGRWCDETLSAVKSF